jgi:sugar lactone lactonase YvrE
MYTKLWIAIIGIFVLAGCKNESPKKVDSSNAAAIDTPKVITHKLVQKWETDTILKVPESVIFDAKNKVLYAANITGTEPWGADGKGSIGKIGLDGKIINVDWVTGLQAPKGMGIYNDKLYVADLLEIAVIDIASGKIEGRIKIKGAKGLNDISIDPSGIIYVTDSQGKRLYKVESGNSVTMMLDSLAGPNGVLVSGKNLYLLNNGGIYKVNQGAKNSISLIADGMEGGTDGVENVKNDDFIISCWAGAVWYLNGDGRKELLFDGKSIGKNTADIGFDPTTKMVYVPTFWKNSVMAFELVEN